MAKDLPPANQRLRHHIICVKDKTSTVMDQGRTSGSIRSIGPMKPALRFELDPVVEVIAQACVTSCRRPRSAKRIGCATRQGGGDGNQRAEATVM